MPDTPSSSPPPPRLARGLLRLTLSALAIGAVLFLALPWFARPALERGLASALQVPVTIGDLWLNPIGGVVSAREIAVGSGDDRLAAAAVSLDLNLARLLAGEIAVDSLAVDAPVVTVRLDESYRPVVDVLEKGEPSAEPSSAALDLDVLEAMVTAGEVRVLVPVGDETRAAKLEIATLRLADLLLRGAGDSATFGAAVELEGSLDGAPVSVAGNLHLGGDERRISGTLDLSGLEINRDVFPLPEALETFRGEIAAHASLAVATDPAKQRIELDLTLGRVELSSGGSDISVDRVALPGVRVDLAARTLDLGPVKLERPVVSLALDASAEPPAPAAIAAEEPAWTVRSGAIEARAGELRLRRGEAATSLAIKSLRWQGLRTDGALRAEGEVASGGKLALDGSLAVDPLAVEVELLFEALSLPPLSPLIPELPVAIARGTAEGSLSVGYREEIERLDGRLTLHDLHTAPPAAERPAEVLAVHRADAELAWAPGPPPRLEVTSLKLSYPYVMVQRAAAGIFPYTLAAAPAAPAAESGAPPSAAGGGTEVRVQTLAVEGGKIEFVDLTLEPFFWTSFTGVTATAQDIRLPQATVGAFDVAAKQNELSPFVLSGEVSERGLRARAQVDNLLLASLNPYVSPLLGYEISSGRLSTTVTLQPMPPLLQADATVLLQSVDVLQTGVDVIRAQSGVPLPIALGLIANPSGAIALDLPLIVDTEKRNLSLGSVVWQAVRSAIVGALTSPLRLLGNLFGLNGASHAFAIEPVPFATGSGQLDAVGEARIAEIARILDAHPGLLLVLMPQVTDDDLDAVGAAGAPALARERGDAARDAFVAAGIERIVLVPWKPDVAAKATGRSAVYVELQDAG